ncbi:hypothetical protein [Croceivirga thetidis]|uniref:Secreted protein n=1 Tax=Croceivirga thetidis TaxID=2721623 RepID=A0ABX1GU56_9FLAO|nr:hypothetical protein [Croceivirga thetidis]NKI32530.1 hypothetical protein [Croceivirga thetidis]
MKKVFSILLISVFTFGMISCETESTAEQEQLYIDSPDTDDIPPPTDSPDTDDIPPKG